MPRITDSQWVKTSFMLPKSATTMVSDRSDTTAFNKYTDTTLGGNFAINPPPQWTRYADLKVAGAFAGRGSKGRAHSYGMGRKYSEMIDDHGQLIHMRFGVPQFNPLTRFFGGAYSYEAGVLSRTGRAPGFFYNLGKVAGFVVTLPLQPLLLAGKFYRLLANEPSSEYYFSKPAMPLYWNAVNSIANGIAVNMGIIPRVLSNASNAATSEKTRADKEDEEREYVYNTGDKMDGPEYTAEDIRAYHELLPHVYHEGGGIDVYAIASRQQRVADAARQRQEDMLKSVSTLDELRSKMKEYQDNLSDLPMPDSQFKSTGETGINAYLAAWNSVKSMSDPKPDGEGEIDTTESAPVDDPSIWDTFADFAESEIRDGGQFVSFRVNHTGDVSESVNNSTGESGISSMVNGTSADVRNKRFNLAEGNLGGGFIGDMLQSAMSSVTDIIGGGLDSIGMGGLMAFAGNAFVDIPEVWQDSSVDLPKNDYTIELRTPYGNKMSIYQNLMVPLSMLLAAALPKSTGRHSYDAPFLVEIYDKGKAQTRLGIIDSISITRGVGNLGWTRDERPLGIDVSFSVVDLSSIMHMPINSSPGIFDEDNAYTDYLATLGSLSLADQVWAGNRLRLKFARERASWRKWTSPGYHAQWVSQTIPGQLLSALAREAERGQ